MKRRLFLKGTLASSTIAVAAIAGLIRPQQLLAAWPESAFSATTVTDALSSLSGNSDFSSSAEIELNAPKIAENGAVVPVTISTKMSGVTKISILVEKNSFPLVASYDIPEGTIPYVSTRIKMGKTSNVIALVEAGGKQFSAQQEVKVTIGGCG
ncbi:MAG: thiosulfate oxidation carrier protein SoxY [Gammaproteobacteria bacterium]|nr:thiosulfate oxidation carrier protein SoxY [Gammaproteobacteria bacterium]